MLPPSQFWWQNVMKDIKMFQSPSVITIHNHVFSDNIPCQRRQYIEHSIVIWRWKATKCRVWYKRHRRASVYMKRIKKGKGSMQSTVSNVRMQACLAESNICLALWSISSHNIQTSALDSVKPHRFCAAVYYSGPSGIPPLFCITNENPDAILSLRKILTCLLFYAYPNPMMTERTNYMKILLYQWLLVIIIRQRKGKTQ